jgi:hypothetical protein
MFLAVSYTGVLLGLSRLPSVIPLAIGTNFALAVVCFGKPVADRLSIHSPFINFPMVAVEWAIVVVAFALLNYWAFWPI